MIYPIGFGKETPMRKFMIAGGLVLASAVGVQAADLIIDEAPAPIERESPFAALAKLKRSE